MKNNLRIMLMLATLGVIFGSAATIFAQQEPIVGGYGAASVTDKDVVAAANFAVKTQAKKQRAKVKLVAVSQAEHQVVAGMNYRLCLKVEATARGKKNAESKTVQVVVFQNLEQNFSLTSWTENGCSRENTEMVNE